MPVLTPKEAGKMTSNVPIFHPQKAARQYLDTKNIVIQPGLHTDTVLEEFGFDTGRIMQLKDEGVFGKDFIHVLSKL